MKVESETVEFKPVHLIFENKDEIELFFSIVEECYWNYSIDDPKRSLLINISNQIADYAAEYDLPF